MFNNLFGMEIVILLDVMSVVLLFLFLADKIIFLFNIIGELTIQNNCFLAPFQLC